MNRNICINKDGLCDEEQCRCHDEEIEAEVEMEIAGVDFRRSLEHLRVAVENLGKSNKAKLEAIEKVKPFLTELENLTK